MLRHIKPIVGAVLCNQLETTAAFLDSIASGKAAIMGDRHQWFHTPTSSPLGGPVNAASLVVPCRWDGRGKRGNTTWGLPYLSGKDQLATMVP